MRISLVRITFTYCLLFSAILLQAQNATIVGKIIDSENNTPLEAASVRIIRMPDSTFVTGALSNEQGIYTANISNPGEYRALVSYIGYKTLGENFSIKEKGEKIHLKNIYLPLSGVELQEAVVVGKLPGMVIKSDTVEYNPDAFRTVKSAVVEDLLKKLPGVEVDEEGNIMVNGKIVNKVMVDGQEFFGNDPKVASKNLPVEIIERLQVLEKKSDIEEMTGIDDGNRQYVINLTIKPDKKKGLMGTLLGGGGTRGRYEANALLNKFVEKKQLTLLAASNNTNSVGFSDMLKGVSSQVARNAFNGKDQGVMSSHTAGVNYTNTFKDKLKISSDFFFVYFDRKEERTSYRENFETKGYNVVDRFQENRIQSGQVKANARIDWQINKLTRVIFTPTVIFTNTQNSEIADYTTINNQGVLSNSGNVDNGLEENNYQVWGTLNVSRSFKKRGRRLAVSAYGLFADMNVNANNFNMKTTYRNTGSPIRDYLYPRRYDRALGRANYNIRLFYNEPLPRNFNLQMSYMFAQNHSNDDKNGFRPNVTDNKVDDRYLPLDSVDNAQTTEVINDYYINRFEIGIRRILKQYNYTVGINLEPSKLSGESYKIDTLFANISRSVVNIGPYFEFICPFTKQKILRFHYRCNSQQPSTWQLQAVEDRTNPNYVRSGNPDLKPSFYSRFRLNYNDYDKKKMRSIIITAYLNLIQNGIVNRTWYDTEGIQYTKPTNVNGMWDAGGTFLLNSPITPYLKISNYTYIAYNRNIGYVNNDKESMGEKTISDNYTIREQLKLTYQNRWLELSARSSVRYNYGKNTLMENMNANTFVFNNMGECEIRFPKDITLVCQYENQLMRGFTEGFDRPQNIVNAELNITIFRNRKGTISVKGYDLLNQRYKVFHTVRSTYTEDVSYNTQPRYVMFQFGYRFNTYKGKGKSPRL